MNQLISEQIHKLNYLTSDLDGLYHQASLQIGVADSVMRVLYAIYDNGDGCPLQTICRQSGFSKQTVNSALRKLEGYGILYLAPFRGKHKKVMLTEKGKACLEQTAERIFAAECRAYADWTVSEMEEYLRLTEKFVASFRKQVQAMNGEAEE